MKEVHDMGKSGRFPAWRMVLPSQAIGRLRALASKVVWHLFSRRLDHAAVSISPLLQKQYEMTQKSDDKIVQDIGKNDIKFKV